MLNSQARNALQPARSCQWHVLRKMLELTCKTTDSDVMALKSNRKVVFNPQTTLTTYGTAQIARAPGLTTNMQIAWIAGKLSQ